MCKKFLEHVYADKRLWVESLRTNVISKGIELPKYRPSFEDASAEDVRSWVKTAISLHRAYASNGHQAKIHSFSVAKELETTWVKIVRGCWCLAAMSNISQSFVGIWRIQSSGFLELENKFYVPGPVLDGTVDDDIEEIRIAVTVATAYVCTFNIDKCHTYILSRDPYIQILLLGVKGKTTILTPVKSLRGARHVLLLNDSFVGYSTLLGDDTYPLLTNWRSGATIRLCPALYSSHPHMILGDIHVCVYVTCQNATNASFQESLSHDGNLAQVHTPRTQPFRGNLRHASVRITSKPSLSFWVSVITFPNGRGLF